MEIMLKCHKEKKKKKNIEINFSSTCTKQPTKYRHLEPHETDHILKSYSYKFQCCLFCAYLSKYYLQIDPTLRKYNGKKILIHSKYVATCSLVASFIIREAQLHTPKHCYSKLSYHAHRFSFHPHEHTTG